MKLMQETKKTFPQLTFDEIKTIDWRSVTNEDLSHASFRELKFVPPEVLSRYLDSVDATWEFFTEEQWEAIIKQNKIKDNYSLLELLDGCKAPASFFVDKLVWLKNHKISTRALAERNLIPINLCHDILNDEAIMDKCVTLQERFEYYANSNWMYDAWGEDCFRPMFLKVAQLEALGLNVDRFKVWDIESLVGADWRTTLYSAEYSHIVGTDALTWDNVIDIMYADDRLYYRLADLLSDVWMDGNPLGDVVYDDSLLKDQYPH